MTTTSVTITTFSPYDMTLLLMKRCQTDLERYLLHDSDETALGQLVSLLQE